jgi:hypothetical protein
MGLGETLADLFGPLNINHQKHPTPTPGRLAH